MGNLDEQTLDKITPNIEDVGQDEKPERTEEFIQGVESLMETGYFTNQEEAEKALEELEGSISLLSNFDGKLDNVIKEAASQLDNLEKEFGAEIADKREELIRNIAGILNNYYYLDQDDLSQIKKSDGIDLTRIPKSIANSKHGKQIAMASVLLGVGLGATLAHANDKIDYGHDQATNNLSPDDLTKIFENKSGKHLADSDYLKVQDYLNNYFKDANLSAEEINQVMSQDFINQVYDNVGIDNSGSNKEVKSEKLSDLNNKNIESKTSIRDEGSNSYSVKMEGTIRGIGKIIPNYDKIVLSKKAQEQGVTLYDAQKAIQVTAQSLEMMVDSYKNAKIRGEKDEASKLKEAIKLTNEQIKNLYGDVLPEINLE